MTPFNVKPGLLSINSTIISRPNQVKILESDRLDDETYEILVRDYFRNEDRDDHVEMEVLTHGVPRNWDEKKIDEFWLLIRKHVIPRGLENGEIDFSGFIFPPFESYRHGKGAKHPQDIWINADWETPVKVNFKSAIFKGEANFSKAVFQESVSFFGATFEENVYFTSTEFTKLVNFQSVTFSKYSAFINTVFKGNTQFLACKFIGRTVFRCIADGVNVWFVQSQFSEAEFEQFNEKEPAYLNFTETELTEKIVFKNINFTRTKFFNTDLIDARFKSCEWSDGSRIILQDEKDADKNASICMIFEDVYRQLKKNFDSNKDWELSGKAYVSEMKMRKKRLRLQKKYYLWLIYWFYDLFGGYTQHLGRPVASLVGLIGVSSIIYYFIDYSVLWAIQRGIYGALPKLITIDIPKDAQFNGYWLIASNIETLLGSTFLVFFILALRKRFKQ